MSDCIRCGRSLPDGAPFCPWCGRKQIRDQARKKRGNGQGSVYKTASGKYRATVVLNYYLDEKGKRHKHTRSKDFEKKKDAILALPTLAASPHKEKRKSVTFKELYDQWLPTHRSGKSTMDGYKAAILHMKPVWDLPLSDISVDDLQECFDDCTRSRSTKEKMKAMVGLVYKYGIPRKYVPDNLNLAPFLIVEGESAQHRVSFTDAEIEKIKKACGSIPHAEDIYCMIYTGFRPSEFLALTAADYDSKAQTLTGGSKTDAGRDRAVTISPKIKAIVERFAASGGHLLKNGDGERWDLKDFRENAFYPALEAIGIDNPLVDAAGGSKRHRITPHTCRHTFATLMKKVQGATKEKLELIGHTSPEMLMYYEDASLEEKRKITDHL
jgi:integrase